MSFKGLAETSLRTKADRVRQGIPDIDNPARKKVSYLNDLLFAIMRAHAGSEINIRCLK